MDFLLFDHEINWAEIFPVLEECHSVTASPSKLNADQENRLGQLLNRYNDVFSDKAGTPIKMHLEPDAKPVFARAHEIPYALREAYAQAIEEK